MNRPILNVIIRTSYRPESFSCLIASIMENFNHERLAVKIIIGYDQQRALYDYIPYRGEPFKIVDLTDVRHEEEPFFYNKYLDILLQEITEGHSIFIDDDDVVIPNDIHRYITPSQSIIVPFLRGENEYRKPNRIQMQMKAIVPGFIGLPCLVFSYEDIRFLHFDSTELSDYNAIVNLNEAVKLRWANCPIVKSFKRNFGSIEK